MTVVSRRKKVTEDCQHGSRVSMDLVLVASLLLGWQEIVTLAKVDAIIAPSPLAVMADIALHLSTYMQALALTAATVIAGGPKLKLSIFTSALDVCACPALAATAFGPLTKTTAAPIINVAQIKIHTPLLLMISLPF